jgi:predicted CXXCH cytochrome family protein
MKRDCQMCHSLAFERIDGTVRTLRHGEPDQVVADLRAYYRTTGPAVPPTLGATPRRLPGLYAQSRVARTYQWAAVARPANAEEAIKAVFSQGGACYDCHVIGAPGTNGKPGWQVMSVHQPTRYMMKGWFDHKAHKEEPCATCHAAAKSTRATDLLLPGIAVCSDCHGGPSSKADVPSNCAMCHSYHADDGAPWKAEADRKRPRGKTVAAIGGPYPRFASVGAP